MSFTRSPAMNVLIQKYEGDKNVVHQGRRRSEVFMSTARKNLVEVKEDYKPGVGDVNENVAKRENVQRSSVYNQGVVRADSKRSSVFDRNRNSLHKNRAAKNISFSFPPLNAFYGATASFAISLEDDDVSPGDIRAEIIGPDSVHNVHFNWVGRTGHGYFTPTETGLHRLNVYCEGQVINGCPASFKVLADRSKVTLSAVDSCSLGTLTELQVNSATAGDGDVQIEVRAPSGRSMKISAVPRHGGNYISNFNPTEVGEWEVSVLYDNEHISGSPYTVNVFDPSQVKVYGLEGGSMESGVVFNADATKAGKGNTRVEIIKDGVDVTRHCIINEEYSNFYKLHFNPPSPGHYNVHVLFNETEVRGSPYDIDIVDSSNVTVSGDGLSLVCVNRTASFEVHGGSSGKLDVEITAPTGARVPAHVNKLSNGSSNVQFIPNCVGDHKVNIYCSGQLIKGCPYTVRVWDASRVIVSNMPTSSVFGQPVVFDIDASKAGSGNIEIMINGGEIACSVQNHGNYKFTASFLPANLDDHKIEMKFNSEQVPGSPWRVMMLDAGKMSATGSGLDFVHIHRTTSFSVNMLGMDSKKLSVKIIAPSGSSVPYRIEQGTNEFRVEYIPTEVGDHTIDVKYADSELSGSPFCAKAYNTAAIEVTDLPDGVVGQPIEFGIDVRKAGEGQLEIMVNNGNLPNTVESDATGVYRMSFVPEEPGIQNVEIIFNKESHPRSPFTCNAVNLNQASVRSLDLQLPVEKTSSFYVHSENISQDLNVNVDISSPTGDRVHADIYNQGNGEYKVEWMPRMPGRHTIDVQFSGVQIDGSPFYVDVFDLSTIRIDNFRHGTVGDEAGFSVDFSNAGTLDQEIQIVGPSGIDVVYDSRELGYLWKDYLYEPEEPGKYQIYIKYGGFQIPGCPFTQDIADGGLPSASGSGLFFAEEDKPAVFNVEVGRRKGDLRVSVSGPNSIAKCSVDPQADGSYTVTYIPVETGIFDISVTWNNTDIPGSPYHPKVIDARKVRIIGGWQHFMDSNERVNLVVGERKQLPFDISEAGPGTLRAEVKAPSKTLDVDIDTHTMGRAVIEFVPEEEGPHYIHIFWSDIPLVNSPFLGFAIQHTPDASKLILTGRGLKEAVVREEAEFIIDGSQAGRGNPDVVLSGVRAEVNVKINPIGNGKFRCTYIPILPGAYLLHITWNGRQLRGSPYKVNVIGAFYPNRVVVNGVGGAILGREMNVGIDTRKAGPGELTAYCMGPHQVAYCELEDNHDGTFRLGVKAQESGRHVLQIKYGGEHVQGSPFVYKVTAQPDASKVRVHGPGVEHGILATYISRFIVETRGAGAGQLTVRIRGPKGAFQVEMYRDSQRDRTILCRFDPTECGLYIISVKWSGVDVPGSPFHVHILDTQEELEQVLNEVSYSFGTSQSHGGSLHSSNPPPRLVYGQWREKI
ncbi:filamin-A-like isoform X3 [Ruditapes philippinarum]|uniref:filamin-A-like isoform X3 n=1 Tax=Ruditapes philippinarum TaxID=129788 RepID=UPI00295C299F|nr:filamin-A-like isoform X3 [Ruditapes philippinarum]